MRFLGKRVGFYDLNSCPLRHLCFRKGSPTIYIYIYIHIFIHLYNDSCEAIAIFSLYCSISHSNRFLKFMNLLNVFTRLKKHNRKKPVYVQIINLRIPNIYEECNMISNNFYQMISYFKRKTLIGGLSKSRCILENQIH